MKLYSLVPALLLALPASAASAQDADAPVRLEATEGMDGEVVALVARVAAAVDAARAKTDYADDAAKNTAIGNAHADLGIAYEANTLWTEALACYQTAARFLPEKPEWGYRIGVCQHALGDVESALETFRAVAGELTSTAVVQARLGDTALSLGLVEEAEAAWVAAIESEKKLEQANVRFPESRVGLALVRVEQERYEEAEALLKEALAINPGYRHAQYVLGLVYRDTGRDAEAKLALIRGLNAFPGFPPDPHAPRIDGYGTGFSRRMMGIENMLASGQLPQATQALLAILETTPEDHFALNLLSRCYQNTQEFDKALEVLARSEQANPNAYQTYVEQSVVMLNLANRQTDPEQRAEMLATAAEKAQKAISIAPLMGRPYYYRGLAELIGANGVADQQAAQQKMQGAIQYMERAHVLGCQEPQLFEYLAQLYANMNRTTQMLVFAKENASRSPENPNAWVFLARAHFTVKEFDDALVAAEQAVETSLGNPQVAQFLQQLKGAIEEQRNPQPVPTPADDGGGGR